MIDNQDSLVHTMVIQFRYVTYLDAHVGCYTSLFSSLKGEYENNIAIMSMNCKHLIEQLVV